MVEISGINRQASSNDSAKAACRVFNECQTTLSSGCMCPLGYDPCACLKVFSARSKDDPGHTRVMQSLLQIHLLNTPNRPPQKSFSESLKLFYRVRSKESHSWRCPSFFVSRGHKKFLKSPGHHACRRFGRVHNAHMIRRNPPQ